MSTTIRSLVLCCLLPLAFANSTLAETPSDWPAWRGPTANGIAADGQTPPVSWSATENVVWKAAVPGRGHSSPIVTGKKVILTTADESKQIQSVVCYDRASGKQLWKTDVNEGGFAGRIHTKNTHATPTVAVADSRIFATFNNRDSVQLTALDLNGRKLWTKNAGPYQPRAYQYGYAPSPVVYKSLVIVSSESEAGAFLAAFDQKTGRQIWRRPRGRHISYSSPIIASVAGKDQLLISAAQTIASYDPATGRPLWAQKGLCTVTCGTMVWDDKRVYASGGYPQRGTIAIEAGGTHKVAWSNGVKCYEQSLLVHSGYIYAVDDGGVAYCWRATDGREMWKSRLGGNVSASPILAGGNIYLSNERGTTYVFKANPEKFELAARNQLGDAAFATPSICGNQIFTRITTRTANGPQEFLYCLGKK